MSRLRGELRRLPAAGQAALLAMSAVVLLAGVVSGKAAATMLGPAGMGRLAIVQGAALVVGMLTSLSSQEAMVRIVARNGGSREGAAAEARGLAVVVHAVLSVSVTLAAAVLHAPLGRLLFEGASHASLLLGCSVLTGVVYAWTSLLLSLCTAYGRQVWFSAASAVGALSTPVVSVVGFGLAGAAAVGPVAVVSQGCSLVAAWWVVRRLVRRMRLGRAWPVSAALRRDAALRREVLRFGAPQMLFHLTTLSFMVLTPVFVQHELGEAATGMFRAAFTVAASVGLVIGMLIVHDQFPRLSALAVDRERFVTAANRHVRLVLLSSGFLALVGMVAAPLLLRVLFTSGFLEAVLLLRWLLLAEVARLVSLVLTAAVSAVQGTGLRFLAGVLSSGSGVAVAVLTMRSHGLVGAGVGPFVGQAAGVVLVAVVAVVRSPLRFHGRTVAAAGATFVVLGAAFAAAERLAWPVATVVAVVGAAVLAAVGAFDARALLEGRREEPRAARRGRVDPPERPVTCTAAPAAAPVEREAVRRSEGPWVAGLVAATEGETEAMFR